MVEDNIIKMAALMVTFIFSLIPFIFCFFVGFELNWLLINSWGGFVVLCFVFLCLQCFLGFVVELL